MNQIAASKVGASVSGRGPADKSEVIRYVLDYHFDGDIKRLSQESGITNGQLRQYIEGSRKPRKSTVDYILHLAFTPEFSIIREYAAVCEKPTLKWIKEELGGAAEASGVYAFYDSLARLCYVGKASTCLSQEIYQALSKPYDIQLPSGIKNDSRPRRDVIHYMSAYSIRVFDSWDYSRHVESLILRISKPPMNKISGSLSKAYHRPPSE